MKKLEKLEEEKAIEEYPGYLGHIWEGDYLDLIKELSKALIAEFSRLEDASENSQT